MFSALTISLIVLLALTMAMTVLVYARILKHRKHLLFSSVGDINSTESWVSDIKTKNFDLVMYYYGNKDTPPTCADLLVKRKGLKFENFCHYIDHNDISQYESVWVVDDDIVMDTESINRMFELFSDYKLWLAQPSFAHDSVAPFGMTRNDSSCVLRYTNFVENNVAIFSTDVIPKLKQSFNEAGTGFGVDFVWTSLLGFPTNKIAVIDAVSCCHPRSNFSSLDQVVPRHLHKLQGAKLLARYGLLPDDWQPTDSQPWPIPFTPREYSKVLKDQ